MINAIRINCYDKDDLRFEVLKGLKIDDAVEHDNDVSSVKEILMKVQKKNKKLFVGVESVTGNNTNNMLVIMHKSMVPDGKDWIRNNYGATCLSVNDVEQKNSVMLHEQHTPEKVKKRGRALR